MKRDLSDPIYPTDVKHVKISSTVNKQGNGNSVNPPTTLLDLPQEVLLRLANSMPGTPKERRPDLQNMAQTNRTFTNVAREALYQHPALHISRVYGLVETLFKYPDLALKVKSLEIYGAYHDTNSHFGEGGPRKFSRGPTVDVLQKCQADFEASTSSSEFIAQCRKNFSFDEQKEYLPRIWMPTLWLLPNVKEVFLLHACIQDLGFEDVEHDRSEKLDQATLEWIDNNGAAIPYSANNWTTYGTFLFRRLAQQLTTLELNNLSHYCCGQFQNLVRDTSLKHLTISFPEHFTPGVDYCHPKRIAPYSSFSWACFPISLISCTIFLDGYTPIYVMISDKGAQRPSLEQDDDVLKIYEHLVTDAMRHLPGIQSLDIYYSGMCNDRWDGVFIKWQKEEGFLRAPLKAALGRMAWKDGSGRTAPEPLLPKSTRKIQGQFSKD